MGWTRADIDVPLRARKVSEVWGEVRRDLEQTTDHPEEEKLYFGFVSALSTYVTNVGTALPPMARSNAQMASFLTAGVFKGIAPLLELVRMTRKTLREICFEGRDRPRIRILHAAARQIQANARPDFVDRWIKKHGRLTTPEPVALRSPPDPRQGGVTVFRDVNELLFRLEAALTELAKFDPKTRRQRRREPVCLHRCGWIRRMLCVA